MNRWRRVEGMPLLLDDVIVADRYMIIGVSEISLVNHSAGTQEESRIIAQRLRRQSDIMYVVVYRAEEAWRKRGNV